jgi:hypothetical protein
LGRSRAVYRVPSLNVEFAEGLEILFPFLNEVWGNHYNRGFSRTANSNSVGNRQCHEGLPHPNLVGQNYPRLLSDAPEDFDYFVKLTPLVGLGHTLI